MTYCLAIRVDDGLVCLADGRITSGNQVSQARKVSLHGPESQQICIMTSGLRSLRDKTIAYFDRASRQEAPKGYATLLDALGVYARCLRKTAEEDREALESSQLTFNLHTIVAGQMPEDPTPTAYLVYPEGNWVEVDERTPYLSIGATAYGKPILDRVITNHTPLALALKAAYLSFDSTRVSSADVSFPLDLLTLPQGERRWRQMLFDYDDLNEQRLWWNEHITQLAAAMPEGPWTRSLLPDDTPGDEPARAPIALVGKAGGGKAERS